MVGVCVFVSVLHAKHTHTHTRTQNTLFILVPSLTCACFICILRTTSIYSLYNYFKHILGTIYILELLQLCSLLVIAFFFAL